MSGGRRRPLSPLTCGLSCCALVIAVLGLWFGAGAARLHTGAPDAASLGHTVVVEIAHLRPQPSQDAAVPAEEMLLAIGLCVVLVVSRPKPAVARSLAGRPHGRAPPP